MPQKTYCLTPPQQTAPTRDAPGAEDRQLKDKEFRGGDYFLKQHIDQMSGYTCVQMQRLFPSTEISGGITSRRRHPIPGGDAVLAEDIPTAGRPGLRGRV